MKGARWLLFLPDVSFQSMPKACMWLREGSVVIAAGTSNRIAHRGPDDLKRITGPPRGPDQRRTARGPQGSPSRPPRVRPLVEAGDQGHDPLIVPLDPP